MNTLSGELPLVGITKNSIQSKAWYTTKIKNVESILDAIYTVVHQVAVPLANDEPSLNTY